MRSVFSLVVIALAILLASTAITVSVLVVLDAVLDYSAPENCKNVTLKATSCETTASSIIIRFDGKNVSGINGARLRFNTQNGSVLFDENRSLKEGINEFIYNKPSILKAINFRVAPLVGGVCQFSTPVSCSSPVMEGGSECSDGIDNDNDGLVDYPLDSGCVNANDASEEDIALANASACSDDNDNDGDGWVDGADPGCLTELAYDPEDLDETNEPLVECSDGIDNDNDAKIDGFDSECVTWQSANESFRGVILGECSDGIDNDNDGLVDYPLDSGCVNGEDEELGDSAEKKTWTYTWSDSGITSSLDTLVPIYWLFSGDSSTLNIQIIKSSTGLMPAGHRVIGSWDLHRALDEHAQDKCKNSTESLTSYSCPWWDNGLVNVRQTFDQLFNSYKNAGGNIDVFVLDYEQICTENWCMGQFPNQQELANYTAIYNDSRSNSLFQQLGFSNVTLVWDWLHSNVPYYIIWNRLLKDTAAGYVNDATYESIKAYYPNLKGSDWGYRYRDTKYYLPDFNGHNASYCATGLYCNKGKHVGTHQSPAPLINGFGPGIENLKLDGQNRYTRTPFNMFRYAVNEMRVSRLSSNVPLAPWFPSRSWPGDIPSYKYLSLNDLYQETIVHTQLTGAEYVLYWNPKNSYPGGALNSIDYSSDSLLLSNTIKEADLLTGFEDKQTLVNEMVSWADDYVLSGMRAGGRDVWRFTPNLDSGSGMPTLSSTLIDANSTGVFLQTTQKKISFFNGTLVDNHVVANYQPVSLKGYWIVQPTGAPAPIVTGV